MSRPKELAMNKVKNYDFTITVPIYNEKDSMDRLVRRLSVYTARAPMKTCTLLIDGGSKGRSLEMMRKACLDFQNLLYITPKANHGPSTAMKAGVDVAGSRYTGYTDADLWTNLEDFDKSLAFVQGYQLASGIRAGCKDTGFKKLQPELADGFRRMMTGDTATDTGCPLRMMWTDYAQYLPFFNDVYRFLLTLLTLVGGKFMETPVRHYPRTTNVLKYHLLNRLTGSLTDCLASRWLKQWYIRYQIKDDNL